ncbi:hypothetical protein C8Q74DRAFT_1372701 [Fomes fomentarius]|nr:hypothetical protein C8Q74DRAFT_1372701 [Fomes fomentarius]
MVAFPSMFPPEIKDRIIDHLHGDVKTLRQCALTCSEWLPRSRCNLFVAVWVVTRKQLFSLCSAITEYTYLRPLVHSVTLEVRPSRPESRYLIETIPIPLLTLLPNLTCWSLSMRPWNDPKYTMEDIGSTEGHGTQEGIVDIMESDVSCMPPKTFNYDSGAGFVLCYLPHL